MEIAGRIAVGTGAVGGIGRALALAKSLSADFFDLLQRAGKDS
ncbi:NAD(P)-dependent dehydrogenase (short-subunit alcohol dehydrogenase family) [Aquamicrobium lusatiense]|uniref:NAD(P)-dependent dehydrogenase (Short-subunit alcohol dehydrogenase family) n=1 Tax=Aquamicrobium lusatiense TaxID=89772 RepID=A0A7W9S148_9HYPH|nr:hypothetical protein [Aquamicrobium lusatiense]MBB6011960.1 NAD(P)-dependent dehydrogenase (short-subunit alcohol dehydrogenase family) [Aquamicrobium lusatiense]